MLPLLIALGFWQLQRAASKESVQQENALHPLELANLESLHVPEANSVSLAGRTAVLKGRFMQFRPILLDNQPRKGRPGLAVLAPFALESGGVMMVAWGWIPASGRRDQYVTQAVSLPASELNSRWLKVVLWPKSHTWHDGHDEKSAGPASHSELPDLLQYLDTSLLARELGAPVSEYLGYSTEHFSGQPLPQLPSAHMSPMRHMAYAVQWFALAVTLVLLYLWYGWRMSQTVD